MIRPLECFIGLRYLGTVGGRGLVSFLSFASLGGIALGVAAVIVILSAMNGLEAESRTRLLSLAEHVTLRPEAASGTDWARLREQLLAVDGVGGVTPFVHLEAMLKNGKALKAAIVRGIDPGLEGSNPGLEAVDGAEQLASLTAGSNRILLGRYVALELGVRAGDTVGMLLPRVDEGRVGIREAHFVVADTITAGAEQHDANLALVNIADASRLADLEGEPEGFSIRLQEPLRVESVMPLLEAAAGPGYRWSSWAIEYRSLFDAMKIEKTMMTILLMLIVGVAAFNIVASLMMVVNEKSRDIAVLRTLGLAPERVMRVFVVQGAVIGVGGTLAGVAVGLPVAYYLTEILTWLERTFGFQVMPCDVFYVCAVPSDIRSLDVVLITGLAFAIAALATLYPSRRAARIEPAEVLRYE